MKPKHIGTIAEVFGDRTQIPREKFLYEVGLTFPPGRAARKREAKRASTVERYVPGTPRERASYQKKMYRGNPIDPVEVGRRMLAAQVLATYALNGYLVVTVVDGVRMVSLTDKFREYQEGHHG